MGRKRKEHQEKTEDRRQKTGNGRDWTETVDKANVGEVERWPDI
jgi:hypothetical protein